ncbi:MAG TPA: 4-alpha-glucanotransferase [Labilithrix sp.]|nr:4-alpha-glucanotransferase [Labilithrix sp.]
MVEAHEIVREALGALGVRRLVLAIHDVSFPSAAGEDIGRGSPYSEGASAFFAFARELGFDGVQLGPQGQTSLGNVSPYDGSVFSKSTLSLPLRSLAQPSGVALLPPSFVDEHVSRTPTGDTRAHYAHAFQTMSDALLLAGSELSGRAERGDIAARALLGEVQTYARTYEWARHDARFEAFASLHGTDDFRTWPAADREPSMARALELESTKQDVVDAWILGQYLLANEHASLRRRLATLGLRVYGDLQVGLSLRDRWTRGDLFLPGYAMGAPPSRTNPEGQPWGYGVLDPRQYRTRFVTEDQGGAVARFFRARVTKLWNEFDGVRIDHPHGLVCPWVYDVGRPDPLAAVIAGARLFETPGPLAKDQNNPHPRLAELAIARPEQIDLGVPPYDDDRVRELDEAQVDEYACLFDIVMDSARAAQRSTNDVLCEVLSTCPEPLARVMKRHGAGRFRVTQKASLADTADGYRGENAEPQDWTMIGNHDTEPLRRVVDRWTREGSLPARAAYLATRLEPVASKREAFTSWLLARRAHLQTAMFAELFVGPAANVLVFWADLFGERDVYNRPGVVSADNWSMRVPRAFREAYRARLDAGEALDVRAALALALRARGMRSDLARALAPDTLLSIP